ncbi:ParB N-terminal domain-containing protein [Caulobacter sp. CCNWLY153]|uniref:ParB/RepB/Spo0J family partition protein n=1 Tax=unclassified Caulobacter TaxID=2648921 RepID=UPI002FF2BCC5
MSASSQTIAQGPRHGAASKSGFVLTETGAVRCGEERVYPLNKLKRSPDNVRKSGHSQSVIEARAASILAKGVISPPVVRPERRADNSETGYAFVTAGESRRLALRLLAKRKLIPRDAKVRCLVDEANDAVEVSLAENIAREPLSPADEFEAFHDLAERQGWGAEAIAARHGVTAAAVRQRLRLAAVAPDLIGRYREGELTLDQLMAFAVSEDHDRQRQVFEIYAHAHPSAIRRAMTEKTVPAHERRAVFVGVEAYLAAGGTVIRDLFTEDQGGYLSDVDLLDNLVAAKLADMVKDLRDAEGWKWGEAHLDYPHGHGLSRVWPKPVEFSPERLAQREALRAEYETLGATWAQISDIPDEVEARMTQIEGELDQDFAEAYAPDDLARAGVWVVLGYDGQTRIERGLVRREDEAPAPRDDDDADASDGAEALSRAGDGDGDDDVETGAAAGGDVPIPAEEAAGDANAPLSAKLTAELTAHRTAGLRLALSNAPDLALVALTHVLVLKTFYHAGWASCLEVKTASAFLPEYGEGVKASPAYEAFEQRFGQWAKQMPEAPEEAWAFVVGLDADSRASLLAYCVARTVNAVRVFDGRAAALAHADALASASDLDMTAFWTPTAERYLARVTKAHVLAAVADGVSSDTAQRLSGLKKADLVTAAEPDLVAARWLPALLRTQGPAQAAQPEPQDADTQALADDAALDEASAPGEVEPSEADRVAAE